MIFVVVISGVLAIGSFKAFEALYIRSAKAKAVGDLSMQSQIVLDQLSQLLYNRIPNSVVGYDGSDCDPIEMLGAGKNVLEWIATDEAQLLEQKYGGFVDLNASSRPDLAALDVRADLNTTNRHLVFAGAFDAGGEEVEACSGAYGWHGGAHALTFGISAAADQLTFTGTPPDEIYEKYYLANGAYAVTRGEDVTNISACGLSEGDFKDFNTSLLLFYGFYPYLGQTYCGDTGGGTPWGSVALLAEDVSGFRASYVNDAIRISIDMNRSMRGSSDVHISKQKAVF